MAETIWIIGASAGIGKALSEKLTSQGYKLALSARTKKTLDKLKDDLDSNNVEVFSCDVIDVESLKKSYDLIKSKFGHIDKMIFAAGVYQPMPLKVFDLNDANKTIDINLKGAFNAFSIIREDAFSHDAMHLVWIASVAGYRGLPNSAAYGVSKAGLISFAEMQRSELESHNTKVQVVNPGFVKTRLTKKNAFKMPMLISPEQAADYILKGMQKNKFDISFPPLFALIMKALRIMPDYLFFACLRKLVKEDV